MTFDGCYVVLFCVTWPYHWTLRHYTLTPIYKLANSGADDDHTRHGFATFKTGKQKELDFVKVASTISAAAAVGAMDWPEPSIQFWLTSACFYCSLLMALFALMQATQLDAVLGTLPDKAKGDVDVPYPQILHFVARPVTTIIHAPAAGTRADLEDQKTEAVEVVTFRPSRNMIFIWQSPVMLMAWAWTLFGVALTSRVVAPLACSSSVLDEKKIAVFYLTVGSLVAMNFAWGSFWMYRAASLVPCEQTS